MSNGNQILWALWNTERGRLLLFIVCRILAIGLSIWILNALGLLI